MLNLIADGYGKRIAQLRDAWGDNETRPWRGPGREDREMAAFAIREMPGTVVPLDADGLRKAPPPRAKAFPRILGRAYGSDGRKAFDGFLAAGAALGLRPDDGAGAWERIGQACLDASLDLPRDEAMSIVPAMPCAGVGDEESPPYSRLGRHIHAMLKHTSRDGAGLLVTFGVDRAHAEIVEGCDCFLVSGGFLIGLLEGITGRSWGEAEARAISGWLEPSAFALSVAAYLALQVDGRRGGYDIPGFGRFEAPPPPALD